MKLISKAQNYTLVVRLGGRNYYLRFQDGKLDTSVEAARLGVKETELDKAVRQSPSFGVRFFEASS